MKPFDIAIIAIPLVLLAAIAGAPVPSEVAGIAPKPLPVVAPPAAPSQPKPQPPQAHVPPGPQLVLAHSETVRYHMVIEENLTKLPDRLLQGDMNWHMSVNYNDIKGGQPCVAFYSTERVRIGRGCGDTDMTQSDIVYVAVEGSRTATVDIVACTHDIDCRIKK